VPGTKTLAYYEKTQLTAVKSFITLGPGGKKLLVDQSDLVEKSTHDTKFGVQCSTPVQLEGW
jgi:hypothetical protein